MSRKLTDGERHLLRLIERDQRCVDFDDKRRWTKVSDQVMPVVRDLPPELVQVLPGGGFARLTEEGEHVVNAMRWLL